MLTLAIRLLPVATLVALLGGSLAGGSGRAAAQELDQNTYTDDVAGWSLEFDDTFWESEEVESEDGASLEFRGLTLSSDLGYVSLRVYEDGITDADDCLADLEDAFIANSESWEDLEAATIVDPPQTDRAAEGALYEGIFVAESDELDAVLYLECREVTDATLAIDAGSAASSYEDLVPELETVLGDIEIEGGSSGRDDETVTPDPDETVTPVPDTGELDGDTFTDTALGYSVTFDDRVWTAELLEDAPPAGVFLSTDDEDLFATVTVDGSLGYQGVDPEECVSGYAEGVEKVDGYSPHREERNADGPEGSREGASGIYSFTYTYEDGTEADLVAYIECRPIDDEAMVRISIQTTEESLADNVEVFQEVLDGIEIEDGGNNDTGDEMTPESDDSSEEVDDISPDEEGEQQSWLSSAAVGG